MSTAKWQIVENIVMYSSVTTITLTGLVMFQSFAGLWSMLMLVFINTTLASD